jgi:hypothetical protein
MNIFFDLLIWLLGKPMALGRKKRKLRFIIYHKYFNYRYMMLIEDENQMYMLDRNNNVFQIDHLRFPKDSDCTRHLINTLVDGVCSFFLIKQFISFFFVFIRNLLLIMIMEFKDIDI